MNIIDGVVMQADVIQTGRIGPMDGQTDGRVNGCVD